MLLRFWKTVVMGLLLTMTVTSTAMAAKQYPSIAGIWSWNGTETVSARIKGYGGGSDKESFTVTAHLNSDHTFELGTWAQSQKKITFIIDEPELEAKLNQYLHYASGEPDLYINITKSSGKATMSNDGSYLTAGKITIKFTIDGMISGQEISGSGTDTMSFKGTRIGNAAAADSVAETDEEQPSEFVKSFANIIINKYLKNKK